MNLQIIKFHLTNLLNINLWKCTFKYIRGVLRHVNGHYMLSNDDFLWILNNGHYNKAESLVHENLGLNYAHLEDFNKAEYYLLKSLDDSKQDKNSYFFMWLGYVFLVRGKIEDSLYYFRKADKLSNTGLNKWLIKHEYVKKRIDNLDEAIKEKYKEILTNN